MLDYVMSDQNIFHTFWKVWNGERKECLILSWVDSNCLLHLIPMKNYQEKCKETQKILRFLKNAFAHESWHQARQRTKLFLFTKNKPLYPLIPSWLGIILRHKKNRQRSSNLISRKYCLEETRQYQWPLNSKVINNHFIQCPGDGKCVSNHYLPIYLTPIAKNSVIGFNYIFLETWKAY